MKPSLAIVVPVLDEAATIGLALQALAAWRAEGRVEVIVVDGQSHDGTVAAARDGADRIVNSMRGRARQMNAGAAKATAEVLLFLHADTRLPENAPDLIDAALRDSKSVWGRFDVNIEGEARVLRMVAALMNRRSRLTGIATGDQAIFVTRAAFGAVGGYPDQPLMEDIELSARLRRIGRPVCLAERVVTSGRRWESHGVWRTVFLMWRLRALYWLGVSPQRLARSYRAVR